MATGREPTDIGAGSTELVARSMTETELPPLFTTYPFAAERAMATGREPTATVSTVCDVRSMTETEFPAVFSTYAFVDESTILPGELPVGMVPSTH
jgi:hypothetical protein